jgi:hypothetical protein
VLSDGVIEAADGHWELGSTDIARDELRAHFGRWIKERRWEGDPIGPKDFGERLAEVLKGAGLSDFRPRISDARPWHYRIPNLRHCREAFCRWLGADIKWPSVDAAYTHDDLDT